MKILLDSNVIFSAFAARGLAHAVFELCLGNHTIVISEFVLSELSAHLRKKLKMPDEKTRLIIDYLRESGVSGQEASVPKNSCRDEEDLPILGLAQEVGADFLITGDKDLLILKRYRGIPIVTPREFWEKEKKNRSR
ncbi:MAG: putative toxin-antitoxin system toxin component, PIN family [Candidatus Aminicenantales bacterium]